MNGLLRRDWQKERKSGFAFFFGWRVTEVHTNGMKFTDQGKEVGSAGARSVRSRCCDTGSRGVYRSPGPLQNVLIAQDSGVNDQTRFMM